MNGKRGPDSPDDPEYSSSNPASRTFAFGVPEEQRERFYELKRDYEQREGIGCTNGRFVSILMDVYELHKEDR